MIVMMLALACIAAGIVRQLLAPPQPDVVAAEQLGPMTVDVLSKPVRVEGYAFCQSHIDCRPSKAVSIATGSPPSSSAPVSDFAPRLSRSQVRNIVTVLYDGANYEGTTQLGFVPSVAYRFIGPRTSFTDVVVSFPTRKAHILSYVGPSSPPVDTWISYLSNYGPLEQTVHETFPGVRTR